MPCTPTATERPEPGDTSTMGGSRPSVESTLSEESTEVVTKQDDTQTLVASSLDGVSQLSNESTEAVMPCTPTATERPGHIWGSVIVMKDGREFTAFPMQDTVLGVGSARSNGIVIKGVAAHEVILEVNMMGEVFLIRGMRNNADIHLLKDDELVVVGKRTLKWKYMYQEPDDISTMGGCRPSVESTLSEELTEVVTTTQIQRLSEEQSQLLRQLFQANISFRR